MNFLFYAFAFFLAGSILSLCLKKYPGILRVAGPGFVVAGCFAACIPSVISLVCGTSESLRIPWQIPFGSLSIKMDPLSALFVLAIAFVSSMSAVFGAGYLRHFEGGKNLGMHWFFFHLLVASMLMVVMAANAVLFLLAWEVMSLSSFFLVMFEHEKDQVRKAGWIYFVATHIGTAFLFVMFLLLGKQCGSLDFDAFRLPAEGGLTACVVFLCAVIGFGTKAGFMPFHVWLPEAHPAAPSHVSALMSGVMIKTGIYGLVRIISLLGMPPHWWGSVIISIGIISGICGVLFALAQHDFKRLLAYHSVENIGIIALGLGIGMLGMSYGNPVMAFLGFAGGLLHVVNHAMFKSLLFLGAGSVLNSTGTREIDHLGGLLRKMPFTAAAFLTGSVAICGLPPLNGFVSEFMIYLSAFKGISHGGLPVGVVTAGILVVASLALIGGLAVACFTKVFAIMFLGEARSAHCENAHEADMSMRVPMLVLMASCFFAGIWGPVMFDFMPHVTAIVSGSLTLSVNAESTGELLSYRGVLASVTYSALALTAMIAVLACFRRRLMTGKIQAGAVTWDCGYLAPNARMQYTASSFAHPITKFFRPFLRTTRNLSAPEGLFPKSASYSSETKDFYREEVYKPAYNTMESWLSKFRQIQHGQLNLYILYIIVALVCLFIWKMR